jgi:hypothetical protein
VGRLPVCFALAVSVAASSSVAWPLRAYAQPVALRAADARGRPFDLGALRGRIVAITFASRYTHKEADEVNRALAERGTIVVNVVDLTGVPSIFKGYAKRRVAEHDEEGRVVHLVDDGGDMRRRFQVEPTRRVDIVVVGPDGEVRGRFVGAADLGRALTLVDGLRASLASVRE